MVEVKKLKTINAIPNAYYQSLVYEILAFKPK